MAPFREIIILRLASWSYSTRKTSKGPVTYTYSVNMHECWLDLCATASSTRLIKMCLRDSSTLFSKRNVPLIHPIWVRVTDTDPGSSGKIDELLKGMFLFEKSVVCMVHNLRIFLQCRKLCT